MKLRTETKRRAIVDEALALFKEHGYEGASMNELAKRLGGSKATLYGYFPSKGALFSAVVKASATTQLSEAAELLKKAEVNDDETLKSTLRTFAEGMLRVTIDDSSAIDVYRMVIAEAGRSDVGELFQASGPEEFIGALAVLLKGAMALGLVRKIPPHVAALQFTALARAEVEGRLYQQNPSPLSLPVIRQMAKRAVEVFLMGAAPR